MFDLHCLGNSLGDFSRSHCLAICAFLVPANLIATSQTILFTLLRRSSLQVFTISTIATIYALLMISHVISWFVVGVVMAPTFILMFLGITCLAINAIAVWFKVNQVEIDYLRILIRILRRFDFRSVPSS
ncbi:hypothetical protein [Pseudanabaena mucicola]|uniref:hypothetical protein n=1 Tax=Pseudanabaena mucicola TaxID=71190 RepID=UPI0018F0494F|nr:hypothetical protein [Pseudanabaena mucicola]